MNTSNPMTISSPLELNILLACFCGSPIMNPDLNPQREAIVRLKAAGIITYQFSPEPAGFYTTEVGDAWVRAILLTPVPRQVFIDDRGNCLTEPGKVLVDTAVSQSNTLP